MSTGMPQVTRADPHLVLGSKDNEDEEPYTGDYTLEEGDHIFVKTISCKVESIPATSDISQWLAKAFHKNSELKSFHKSVPTHFHDFKDLFLKSSFECLPDHKVWDHAIELTPGAKLTNCKVYLLTPNEQSEMDEFIQENLHSGHIHLSKSPMALPVFFIKKKDGSMAPFILYRIIVPWMQSWSKITIHSL